MKFISDAWHQAIDKWRANAEYVRDGLTYLRCRSQGATIASQYSARPGDSDAYIQSDPACRRVFETRNPGPVPPAPRH